MIPKNFSSGDLVWAKMKGYPPWPGKVVEPPADQKPRKSQHYIFFFGSENHAWILAENIVHHSSNMVPANLKKKPAQFQAAVDIIITESEKQAEKTSEVSSENQEEEKCNTPQSNTEPTSDELSNVQITLSSSSSDSGKKEATKKRPIKRSHSELSATGSSPVKVIPNNSSDLPSSSITKQYGNGDVSNISKACASTSDTESPPKKCPPSPSFEFYINELLNKADRPNELKVGFLGLGSMGEPIARNLLKSGHDVTVWDCNARNCEELISEGANSAQTPAAVVSMSNITFSCVSDPESCKSVVFGKNGVLHGLEKCVEGKGYVEMTTIDSQTSKLISESVIGRGGTYLEAHINGSLEDANRGSLLILAAGNQDLFTKCKSCFDAISKNSRHISHEVGCASQMKLVLRMFEGVVYAALGEAMALTEKMELPQEGFVDILEHNQMCPAIIEKSTAICNKDYSKNNSLKHTQRHISMGLTMGSLCDQSTPLASAANEVYKHARLLRYENEDVCAIYKSFKA